MTEQELHEQRRVKWRVNGPANAVRTLEAAAEFVQSVGVCLMHPAQTGLLAPTFIGAYAGTEEQLPSQQQAFRDPRTAEAQELCNRLLQQRLVFGTGLIDKTTLLISPEMLPYFYALLGDRNPETFLQRREVQGMFSPLALEAFAALERSGPLRLEQISAAITGHPSGAALERALHELDARVLIARVGNGSYDLLLRWVPELVKQGSGLSMAQGLSALISKYLDTVVAASLAEIEAFFTPMAARSKVRDAVQALLAAREFAYIPVGKRTLIHFAPAAEPMIRPRQPRRRTTAKP